MRNRSGFTLIEILVVVVVTVLLFGMLFRPLVASFNYTRAAQARIEAQDAARLNLTRISRELSGAMFVYDNSTPMVVPAPKRKGVVPTPQNSTALVYFAKLDIVLPRMIMHCNAPSRSASVPNGHPDDPNQPNYQPRDYSRDDLTWPAEVGYEAWPSCPADGSQLVEARPIQPLTPSGRIVRYFVGLRYPDRDYRNRYEKYDAEPVEAEGENNTYVLYRAEFGTSDDDLKNLFPLDENTKERNRDYAGFFYDKGASDGNGRSYMENWQAISRIVGLIKDVDLISFRWDDGNERWIAKSSVRFEPTAMQNDPLTPTYLSDIDAEVPRATPTVYRADYGLWTSSYIVRIYRNLNDPSQTQKFYYTAFDPNPPYDLCLWSGSTMIFDITQCQMRRGKWGELGDPDPELTVNVSQSTGTVDFVFTAWKLNSENPGQQVDTSVINGAEARSIRLHELDNALTTPDERAMPRNAFVVPGSEEVIGPDQTPTAASEGRQVRYTRVPLSLGMPGRNQYKIDYQTGEMWFASGLNEDLPAGTVYINYKFHNNERNDIVKADYTTQALLTITFGIRVYDPNSGKTHLMELTDKVHVRNVGR